MPLIHPLLLCGGSGTRLWPLSRQSCPKRFVRLAGDESLLQQAATRLAGPGFAPPVIVTEQLDGCVIAPAPCRSNPRPATPPPRALAGDLVTFGITPTRAATGYGWLELAEDADPTAGTRSGWRVSFGNLMPNGPARCCLRGGSCGMPTCSRLPPRP